MHRARLGIDNAQVLIVDVQARLLPHIHGAEPLVAQIVRFCRAASELPLPVTLLEQYPQGLGRTVDAILAAAEGAARLEKRTFSACGDEAIRARLRGLERPNVVLVGIETHVCVQKTALDLLVLGLQPFVLADAVGSRRALDHEVAVRRMAAAGAIVTTVEAAVFEMLERCDTDLFRRLLPIVK